MDASHVGWLPCEVSPGMFDGELGVDGRQFDGSVFSLFAPIDAVDYGNLALMSGQCVPGRIRVQILGRQDNLALVELPRQTFQDGPFITVKINQLESRPQPQTA